MRKNPTPARGRPAETKERLLAAAEKEFNRRGFFATDTNRIARAAGYAPQTFYRHFADKTAIFVAVYDRWWRAEGRAIGELDKGDGALDRIADTAIAFHTRWRVFRRSLRHLAVTDARVRAARAAARLKQIEALKRRPRKKKLRDDELIAALLALERLCDAAAEGELEDMGFSKKSARDAVRAQVRVTHGTG
jgi:AcrR family transcriptional regulator